MSYGVKLKVWGDRACFTRPEMKVERVSYDVMTPSAARGILEAIHWKPAIRWVIDKIHVLKPIRFQSIRRNEVGSKAPAGKIKTAMNRGSLEGLHLLVDEDRQQRASTVLTDVAYVIESHFELTDKAGPDDAEGKHLDMFIHLHGSSRTTSSRSTVTDFLMESKSSTGYRGLVVASDPPEPPDGMELADPIPISALQHAVYCLRQAALIHIERVWAENRFTAEGRVLHDVTHEAGTRKERGVRRVTALPLASRRLNLAGVADLVEFRRGDGGETPYPVEFKRGKPKKHRADEVQLCAQALCLEEMTGMPVPGGAVFYGEIRRRVVVPFDAGLRKLTEDTALAFGALVAEGRTPPPVWRAERCRACSLLELCRPKAMTKSALGFRNRALAAALDTDEAAG